MALKIEANLKQETVAFLQQQTLTRAFVCLRTHTHMSLGIHLNPLEEFWNGFLFFTSWDLWVPKNPA